MAFDTLAVSVDDTVTVVNKINHLSWGVVHEKSMAFDKCFFGKSMYRLRASAETNT